MASKKPSKQAPVKSDPSVVKRAELRAHTQAFIDSFRNTVTNVGTSRDKTTYGDFVDPPLLTPYECEVAFKHDLARKIVMKPVMDALRAGFSLRRETSQSPSEDEDDARQLLKAYKKLVRGPKDTDKVKRGATWGRLHGGGGLILGVKGGSANLAAPLDDEEVRELSKVWDFDRQDMTPVAWYPDGEVEVYRWTPQNAGTSAARVIDIHESRIIVFPGAMTTNRERAKNQQWDHSVLQPVIEVLRSFHGMFGSVDGMFADASQSIFKLQGLISALAEQDGEGTADVQTRLQLLDLFRSSLRSVMLDAGDADGNGSESFEVIERNIGQVADTMVQYYTRLAAAADMPLTVLLGQSPSGMDATGESDMILYFNTVDVYRQSLTPLLLRIIHILARTILGDENAEEWAIEWPELARPKPLDVATAENMRITSATTLVTAGVVLPEEVALSLPNMAPTLGLRLDMAARLKALPEALKELSNREMTGPNAPEEPPEGVVAPEKKTERKTPSKAAKRQV